LPPFRFFINSKLKNMKLSIIIPALEEEKFIKKTLLSLRELKNFDYEIIVSDGHSKDRTVEIAKEYADKVIVHDGKTRQTIGQGRNRGAEVARGDFFVFIDSDVFIPNINDFFAKAISEFEKNEKLVAFTVCLKTLPEYETLGDKISFAILNFLYWFMNDIMHKGSSSGEFQMFRAEAFKKIKGYSEILVITEDTEIFMRMTKIGEVKFDYSLCVMHTSRRAHNEGWIPLWIKFMSNTASALIFKKSIIKEWKVSR
jgi:glycosyltransferase involved in cell wall biosynthesis